MNPSAGDSGTADSGSGDPGATTDDQAPTDGALPGCAVSAGDPQACPLPGVVDNARVVSHTFPVTLLAGESSVAELTMGNTGNGAWTAGFFYRLGAVDDSDPFAGGRVELDGQALVCGDPVSFGTFTFPIALHAPAVPGIYRTDWRMLREGCNWFGETLALDIEVVEGQCIDPVPPPLARIDVKVHIDQGYKKVLDSTPIACDYDNPRDTGFCAQIGFTDLRRCCPPRPEGHPEAAACNELVMGFAPDTGRVGPSWTFNGLPCDGQGGPNYCVNHPSNQFLVFVFGSGTAQACSNVQPVCGQITVAYP